MAYFNDPGMDAAPTVYVVEDDEGTRDLIVRLMESVEISVVTFTSAREFLDSFEIDSPGCLITDVRLPEMSGIELQEELHRRHIHLPVVIVTGYADVAMAVRSMKAGAFDFLEKPFRPQTLLDSVQHALAHDRAHREAREKSNELAERYLSLTPREREVVDLVVAGDTSKEIAEKLGLSPKTVHVHRAEATSKMKARSPAQLSQFVMLARQFLSEQAAT